MLLRRAAGAAIMVLLSASCAPAFAGGLRFAVLIGNQDYLPAVGALKNPVNDVELLRSDLEKGGFKVTLIRNASRDQMLGAARQLAEQLKDVGAIGLFYYSGHGAADADTKANYLIPTDVTDATTSAVWDKSLKLDEVLEKLERANGYKFVVFDACRSELKLAATRSIARGLTPVAVAPPGTFIMYSTHPGAVAFDGDGRNSPYAEAFSSELEAGPQKHFELFTNVKARVQKLTNGAQRPWDTSDLTTGVYLIEPASDGPGPSTDHADVPACEGADTVVSGQRRCLKVGETFKECPDCPEMIVVPPGSIKMQSDEVYQEPIVVSMLSPFAVGKFEVTFAEWDACVAAGGCTQVPKDYWGRGRRPVMEVGWGDIDEQYLPWLNKKLGLPLEKGYRLLTEAEWEYAARAGTTGDYSISPITPETANYGNIRLKTVEVDAPGFPANPWGLYHVHGNVWEWVQDCFVGPYGVSDPSSPPKLSASQCKRRVVRGGSWRDGPELLKSSFRNSTVEVRHWGIGFRVARTLSP